MRPSIRCAGHRRAGNALRLLTALVILVDTAAARACGEEAKTWWFGTRWTLRGCTTLDLRESDVQAADMALLAQALKSNTDLSILDLSYSKGIGDAGALALAEGLRFNKGITHLDLSHCSIGDTGALALAEALKANSAIKMFVLRGPPLEPNGFAQQAVEEVVRVARSVRRRHFGEDGGMDTGAHGNEL